RSHSWHMTIDAAVARILPAPLGERQLTAILLMTGQAALAIMGRLRLWRGCFMRIVTGDAPELALTGRIAPAGVHLFDLAGEFFLLVQVGRLDKHRPEGLRRQPRTIIE